VEASDGKRMDVQDPFTGKSLGTVPDMTRDNVASAIVSGCHKRQELYEDTKLTAATISLPALEQTAAKAALPAWSALTAYQRQSYLNSLLSLMRANADDLALILTAENGKPLAEAKGEIAYGAGFVDWFAGEAVRYVVCSALSVRFVQHRDL
jgi:succinate-semialdehyde dehydrogenase/glutarate-semialdehyde dehydrogenase